MMIALIILLIVGAISGGWVHAFAMGFDMFVQDLVWNDYLGVTISSRAGLAARNGKPLGAKIINALALNPRHCEEAIANDIARAKQVMELLA
jgi:hypothetical protein